jgi:hypothetical protein
VIDTSFVSTKLSVHPSSVHTAVGKWHQSLPSVTMAHGCVRFGHRLWLATKCQQASSDPLELYAVRGILWMNGRPIRVKLEFSMWSATVSQLAFTPAHLGWPVRTERYARRAAQFLEDVAGSIAEQVALRFWSQEQPGLDTPSLHAATRDIEASVGNGSEWGAVPPGQWGPLSTEPRRQRALSD